MEALFIGQSYIDVTILADRIPTGDEKTVADDYAVSFGGNAVTAAFCCAKLGIIPDLLSSVADDWLGRMFRDMTARYGIRLHARHVAESSLSFVIPNDGKRAILRARDANYLHPFPRLNLDGCRGLHLDGHQADAAIRYARLCRERGILTSLDGGGLRENTPDLLSFIDVAVVSERLCEQMKLDVPGMLDLLHEKGCRIGAVTMGERGLAWYDENGTRREMASLPVPSEQVIDTNGAGDVFHGAYLFSAMRSPDQPWEKHFDFARAASAYKIHHLGNEAGLPSLADVERTRAVYCTTA